MGDEEENLLNLIPSKLITKRIILQIKRWDHGWGHLRRRQRGLHDQQGHGLSVDQGPRGDSLRGNVYQDQITFTIRCEPNKHVQTGTYHFTVDEDGSRVSI